MKLKHYLILAALVLAVIALLLYVAATTEFNFDKSVGDKPPRSGIGYQRTIRIDFKDKTMVHFGDFTANMRWRDQAGKYVRVKISGRVTNSAAGREIKRENIIVRDVIINELNFKNFSEISTPRGKEKLKENIKRKINARLKDGQIESLYFTKFMVQ